MPRTRTMIVRDVLSEKQASSTMLVKKVERPPCPRTSGSPPVRRTPRRRPVYGRSPVPPNRRPRSGSAHCARRSRNTVAVPWATSSLCRGPCRFAGLSTQQSRPRSRRLRWRYFSTSGLALVDGNRSRHSVHRSPEDTNTILRTRCSRQSSTSRSVPRTFVSMS